MKTTWEDLLILPFVRANVSGWDWMRYESRTVEQPQEMFKNYAFDHFTKVEKKTIADRKRRKKKAEEILA